MDESPYDFVPPRIAEEVKKEHNAGLPVDEIVRRWGLDRQAIEKAIGDGCQ